MGSSDRLSERKSFTTPQFQLSYAKMLYQEVMENSLRSGRSQGKVRENERQSKKWSPDVGFSWNRLFFRNNRVLSSENFNEGKQ